MKILSIGNFLNPSWDGSLPDEEHIAKALEELGHEVMRWQREKLVRDERPDAGYLHCDFILVSQWDGYPDYKFDNLRIFYDCPIVYWSFDYQNDGQHWHEELVRQSTLYLSKRVADSKYPNWQWLSQDFAPSFLDKYPDWHESIEQDIDVLFTGSYLPWATERNETLKAVNEKFNLVIHSVNEWPEEFKDVRPPMMDDSLPYLYARAKVILSIDHTIEAGYWSDRNAQIMACGRRPLFRYVPLSESTFHNYVDYFYSIEDCLNKIKNWDEKPTNASGLYVKDRVKDLLTIVQGIL